MPEYANPSGLDADAKFLGWQQTLAGKLIPIFIITAADHPLYGSTATGNGLRKLNLQVPGTSLPQMHIEEGSQL